MTRTRVIAAFLAVAVAAGAAAAYARWASTVDGTAAARSQGLAGIAPTAVAAGTDVTVSWAAATFSDGTAATSYAVTRYNGLGVAQATLADCAGSISTLSCVEHNVPVGTWTYAVTPKFANWTGTESAKSLPVAVAALDSTAPALQSLEMSDANGNGKVDRVIATFNEALAAPYLAGTTGWTLANVPSGGSLASVAVSGSAATLTLAEGAGAVDTAVGSFTVALAATAGGIRDTFDNRSSFAATSPADRVAPMLVGSPQMLDVDRDGLVDRVTATFTETLAASTATAPWTLANVPSGGSPASVSTSGAVATLALTEGAGARNTAVGTFTVALSAAAGGVRDAADNRASFAATAPADKAAPVGFVTLVNGGTAGKADKGDTVTVAYSERLTLSTVCAAWTDNTTDQTLFANNDVTVTIATNDVLSVSSLACPSLAVGSVSLGGDYVTGSTAARFGPDNGDGKRSEVRWSAATNTLTVYLGTLTGTTANVAASGTARYTPAAGITDLAGNAVGAVTFDSTGQRF